MLRFFKRWLPAKDEISKRKAAAWQAFGMLRREYKGEPLEEKEVDKDPIVQFSVWFNDALKTIKNDPNAMIAGTVNEEGQPATRTVLLKGFDESGFVFYTNYISRKGSDLMKNPKISLTFYWPELMRQIHIAGVAEKTSKEMSEDYFNSRPVGSRLSASLSNQSSVVGSRKELEDELKELERKYSDGNVPLPENWGGIIVKPHRIEFWQGRLNRLHDRVCYAKEGDNWNIQRLSP